MWWLAAQRKPLNRQRAGKLLIILLQTLAAPNFLSCSTDAACSHSSICTPNKQGLLATRRHLKDSCLAQSSATLPRDDRRCTSSIRALAYPPCWGGHMRRLRTCSACAHALLKRHITAVSYELKALTAACAGTAQGSSAAGDALFAACAGAARGWRCGERRTCWTPGSPPRCGPSPRSGGRTRPRPTCSASTPPPSWRRGTTSCSSGCAASLSCVSSIEGRLRELPAQQRDARLCEGQGGR